MPGFVNVNPPPIDNEDGYVASGQSAVQLAIGLGYVYDGYGGQWIRAQGTSDGALKVESTFPETQRLELSAFGEQTVAQLVPKIHIQFIYNINTDQVVPETTGSGTIGVDSDGLAFLQTGASSSSSAKLSSKDSITYIAGIGAMARITAIFSNNATGSQQFVGVGNNTDGFFIGFYDTNFCINRIRDSVDNITNQPNFNIDTLDGNGPSKMIIDPTKGNVYKIQYQWLGFGEIRFSVENPNTGRFITFHTIQYANNNIQASVINPNFTIQLLAKNTTNTSNLTIKSGSIAAFLEGKENSIGIRKSKSNIRIGVSSETNILTIKNKSTYQGKENLVPIQFDFFTVSNEGSKPVQYRLLRDTTLGGTPNFQDINTNTSIAEFDTDGTTVSGGEEILIFQISKAGSDKFFLDSLDIILRPGETMTLSAKSSNTTEANVGLSWRELF